MDNAAHSPAQPSRLPAHGFTLIELLVVISISAILIAAAIPQFNQFVASKMLRAQVSSMATSFRLARAEALKRGRPVTLCRSDNPEDEVPSCAGAGDWTSGWIVFEDGGPRGTYEAGDVLIHVQPPMPNQGSILVRGGGDYLITYLATGTPLQGNPIVNRTIEFFPNLPEAERASSSLRRNLVIDLAGRVRAQKPSA